MYQVNYAQNARTSFSAHFMKDASVWTCMCLVQPIIPECILFETQKQQWQMRVATKL